MSNYSDAPQVDWSGDVQTAKGVTIPWKAVGNPRGEVVLCVHGGPGLPFREEELQFLDPTKYLIVTWHQRECVMGSPHAEVGSFGNVFHDASHDMEKVRQTVMQQLKENEFVYSSLQCFGYSYGGMVATVWALQHPDKLQSLKLTAPYFDTRQDMELSLKSPREKKWLKDYGSAGLALARQETLSRSQRLQMLYESMQDRRQNTGELIDSSDVRFREWTMDHTRWPAHDMPGSSGSTPFWMAKKLSHVPIQIIALAQDEYISPEGLQTFVEELQSHGHPRCELTIVQGHNHFSLGKPSVVTALRAAPSTRNPDSNTNGSVGTIGSSGK